MINVLKRKIFRNLEDFGWRRTLVKAILYLLRPIYIKRVYRVYVLDLDSYEVAVEKNPEYSYKFISDEDEDIIREIESIEEWLKDRLKPKLQNQNVCLACIHDQHVVGFNIVSFSEVYIPLLEKKEILESKEAWSDQITVIKAFRRKGIGNQLRQRMIRELKKRNIKYFFGGSLISNQPSQALARSVGFKQTKDLIFRKIFFFKSWRERKI